MKMVRYLEAKAYEEQMKSYGFFSLGKSRLSGNLMAAYSFLTRGMEEQALITSL